MRSLRLLPLLPSEPSRYRGTRFALWFLAAVNLVGTVRSLIHIFTPDSGAESIASMDIGVAGGPNVVDLLAQWGGAQLLEALLIWIALWRYRGLTPLMLGIVTLEQALRVFVGTTKPLVTAHVPPGALSGWLLPVAAVVFVLSLISRERRAGL